MTQEEEIYLIQIIVERFIPFMNRPKMELMLPRNPQEDDLIQKTIRARLVTKTYELKATWTGGGTDNGVYEIPELWFSYEGEIWRDIYTKQLVINDEDSLATFTIKMFGGPRDGEIFSQKEIKPFTKKYTK